MKKEEGFYYPILVGFVGIVLFLLVSQINQIQQEKELEWWEKERSEVKNAAESSFAIWQLQSPSSSQGVEKKRLGRFTIEIRWSERLDGFWDVYVVALGERGVKKSLSFIIDPANYRVVSRLNSTRFVK